MPALAPALASTLHSAQGRTPWPADLDGSPRARLCSVMAGAFAFRVRSMVRSLSDGRSFVFCWHCHAGFQETMTSEFVGWAHIWETSSRVFCICGIHRSINTAKSNERPISTSRGRETPRAHGVQYVIIVVIDALEISP
jgi:hypothetical protein